VQRLDGGSLGLAVALAARAADPSDPWAPALLDDALVATGRVTETGEVQPVSSLVEKARALGPYTLVAVSSRPHPGGRHPAAQDPRVREVTRLDAAWRALRDPSALRRVQQRLWRALEGALSRGPQPGEAWLRPPAALQTAAWQPWALRKAGPRLSVLRGSEGAGKSVALRALADRVWEDVAYDDFPDDLVVSGGRGGLGLWRALWWDSAAGALPDDGPDDATCLRCEPFCRATQIWVFLDDWEEDEEAPAELEALLGLDPRIRVVLATGEHASLDGVDRREATLVPAWRDPAQLTDAARAGLVQSTPLSRARVLLDPTLLAPLQRVLGREPGRRRLWLHHARADEAAAWAGQGAVAAELASRAEGLLLLPGWVPTPDGSDCRFGLHGAHLDMLLKLDPEGVGPALSWLDADGALSPPARLRPALLARAFRCSDWWADGGTLPWPAVWLRARDRALRPVLVDVLAEGFAQRLGAPPAEREASIDGLLEQVWSALDPDCVAHDLGEPAMNDRRLLLGLLLRALWSAADAEPDAPAAVAPAVVALVEPDRGEALLADALRDALLSPQVRDLLFVCRVASVALLDAVGDAARVHLGAAAGDRLWARVAPLRGLLCGDPSGALARLAGVRPAPTGPLHPDGRQLVAFDEFPSYDSDDALLDLLWTQTVLVPDDAPEVLSALGTLAHAHWADVEDWLQHPGLAGVASETVEEFLNNQWLALHECRHQPWTGPWADRLVPAISARSAALGVSLDEPLTSQDGAAVGRDLTQALWDHHAGLVPVPPWEGG
jgi:hypothetical protein